MALAKTTRPALARTLARPRLFRLLDRAGRRPVTWVWAPPGAGKTAMVASYLAARRRRALWYQIDSGDADVATFFYYLGRAAPGRKRPLPLLTAEYRQGLAVFARRFFRELYARLPGAATVVVDNYQEVPAGSELHEVMAEAVAEIPEGIRLIVISRAEPPAELARHRAQQLIESIEWPELRFTPAEAERLVRRLAPGRWSPKTIRALHGSADGWCAGMILQLDRLRHEGQTREGDVAPGQASEVLFDYFAGEIFKRTEPRVQDVLLQTAFLPRVTASMATALTGQPASADVLTTLHRQNYFTDKQAGREPSYQYHPLFRQFLLSQAERTYSPEMLAKIRRDAAQLLDDAGETEATAALLRDARDWQGLGWLVLRHAATLVAQGRFRTVEDWLAEMPASMFEGQPWLLFWRGIGMLGWRHTECQRDLEQAFHSFRRRGDTLGMYLAWSGIIFAYFGAGEFVPMDRWIDLLEEIMAETSGFPSKGVETRVSVAMLCAITMRQPNHRDAARWVERAIELVRSHPDRSLRAIAAGVWVHFEIQRGDLAKVAGMIDDLRVIVRDRNTSPVFAVNASAPVAWYEALTALPAYRSTVADRLELTRTTGMFYSSRHLALMAGIAGALSDGDVEAAAPWFREIERDLGGLGYGFRAWHRWFVVWDALVRGDITRAAGHQPEMVRLAREGGRPMDSAIACLMSAHVLHARRRTAEAQAQVDQALDIARTISSPFVEFMARLIEAHLRFDDDREREGLTALRRAMALGRAQGYVNSFTWIPAVMARLCVRALDAGIEVEYVRDVIRRRGLVPDEPPLGVEAWPWPIKIYTLGRFEVRRDDAPVRFPRKVQRRPLALLKTLTAAGGRAVREDLVMDAFWPDAPGDAARMALTSAVHRLRGLLGHERAVVRQEGLLSLDARLCWVDAWAIEHLLTQRGAASLREDDVRKALGLYRGAFLAGEEEEIPQATALADGLRRRLLRHVAHLARQHEATDGARAAELYEEALRIDPCAEDVARHLMHTYHRLGRRAAVADVYGRCRAALATHLGGTPSPETERLFKTLGSAD